MSMSRLVVVLVPSLFIAAGCTSAEPTGGTTVQFVAGCEQEIIDACDAAGVCDAADLDGICDADAANDCPSYVHIKCALSGLDDATCETVLAEVCAPMPVPPDAAACEAMVEAGCAARGIPADACAAIIDANCHGGGGATVDPGSATDAVTCAAAYDACIADGGTPDDCRLKLATMGC